MPRYAVSYINFFDNDLRTEFIVAESIREAVFKYTKLQDTDYQEWLKDMPEGKEGLKQFFFDCDSMIDIVELPSN